MRLNGMTKLELNGGWLMSGNQLRMTDVEYMIESKMAYTGHERMSQNVKITTTDTKRTIQEFKTIDMKALQEFKNMARDHDQ